MKIILFYKRLSFMPVLRVLVALIFLESQLNLNSLQANPSGEQIVAGQAEVSRNGSTLNVNQSTDQVIINWQDFSVALGETTKFLQPSASSVALNRVMGDNLSSIFGTLESNGQLFLINPNGIIVGSTGVINTAGFTASTHDVSNAEFLAGQNLQFSSLSAGSITNLGSISATGGNVFLIAEKVQNSGTILASNGTVGLAAGQTVLLTEGQEKLFVQPAHNSNASIINSGLIQSAASELKAAGGNMYALAIKNEGVIRATGSELVNGRVLLKASGGSITNTGVISATNQDGSGGEIELAGGQGSSVNSTIIVGGILDASAVKLSEDVLINKLIGGKILVTGQEIKLRSDSQLKVDGAVGGGEILVGGDYRGENALIQNAQTTTVEAGAKLSANALERGDGGKVILWSDDTTTFQGLIEAKGGTESGDGGFAEVSGKDHLAYDGITDLRAAKGATGTLLLDPANLTIVNTVPGVDEIAVSVINSALASVTLAASTSITLNNGVNINIAASGVQLTFDAPTIYLGGNVTTNNANQFYNGAVQLFNTGGVTLSAGTGSIDFFSTVSSVVGGLTVNSQFMKLGGNVSLYSGNQLYNTKILLKNDLSISSSMGGNITFNNTIDSDAPATPRSLTVSTLSGTVSFNQGVGMTNKLTALNINTSGAVATNINGPGVRVNSFNYNSPNAGSSLTLNTDIDVNGNMTVVAYDLTVKKLVETTISGGAISFTVGNSYLQEDLGDIISKGTFTLGGSGSAFFGGGPPGDGVATITTFGSAINLDPSIELVGNVQLDTTGGGVVLTGADVVISGSVDTQAIPTPRRSLTINAGTAGDFILNNAVGFTRAPAKVEVLARNISLNSNVEAGVIDLKAQSSINLATGVQLNTLTNNVAGFTVLLNADTISAPTSNLIVTGSSSSVRIISQNGFDDYNAGITTQSLAFSGSGDFSFESSTIKNWAGTTTGSISITNSVGDLTVGSVGGIQGLTSLGSSVTLSNSSGAIIASQLINSKLDTDIDASTGINLSGGLKALNATLDAGQDIFASSVVLDGSLTANSFNGSVYLSGSNDISSINSINAANFIFVNNEIVDGSLAAGSDVVINASVVSATINSSAGDVTINAPSVGGTINAGGDITVGSSGDLNFSGFANSTSAGRITLYATAGSNVLFSGSLSTGGEYVVYTTEDTFLGGLSFDEETEAAAFPEAVITPGQNTLVLLSGEELSLDNEDNTYDPMDVMDTGGILTGVEDEGDGDMEGGGLVLIDAEYSESNETGADGILVDKEEGYVGIDDFGNTLQITDKGLIILLKEALDEDAQQDLLEAMGITLEEFNEAAGGNIVISGEVFEMGGQSSGSLESAPKALIDALSDKAKVELELLLNELLDTQDSSNGVSVTIGQVLDMNGTFLPSLPPDLVIALSAFAKLKLEQALK